MPQTGGDVARAAAWAAAMFLIGTGCVAAADDEAAIRPLARVGWVGPPLEGDDAEPLGAEWFRQGKVLRALAFSPNGRVMAAGGESGEIQIRRVESGALLHRIPGKGRGCWVLAFSPDGRKLAGGWMQPAIALWEVESGKELWKSSPRELSAPLSMAFSPDGQTLVSGCADGTIRLWDVAAGGERRTLQYGPSDVRSVTFSPNGRLLAAGGGIGLKQWEMPSGRELATGGFRGGRGFRGGFGFGQAVNSVAFSQDGLMLAVGGERNGITLTDVASGRLALRLSDGGDGEIDWLAFLPGGRILVAAGTDRRIHLWDIDKGEREGEFPLEDKSNLNVRAIALSRDGWIAAAGGPQGSVRVYDLAAGAPGAEKQSVDALWVDLGDADVLRAHRAVGALAARPKEALALLATRLRPSPPSDARDISTLVVCLDANRFAERESAEAGLRRLGERAEPALKKLVTGTASAEARERAIRILASLQPARSAPSDSAERRSKRALMVLGRLGTPEAREILERLASGAQDAPQTVESKRMLERLAPR
jgi:hypothetical protein